MSAEVQSVQVWDACGGVVWRCGVEVWCVGCMEMWCGVWDVWRCGVEVWCVGCVEVWCVGCVEVWCVGCVEVWCVGCGMCGDRRMVCRMCGV